jgi:TatD DNase family protein
MKRLLIKGFKFELMNLIDTHCHLYLQDFKVDLNAIIQRASSNGVRQIFLPAIDSETHDSLITLAESATNISILPMMGLHPCSVKENFEEELKIVEAHLNSGRKFYGIGETGLDYYWDVSFKEQQIISFERQIGWSIDRSLPVIIHSRQSTGDCIASVAKFKGKAKGIFHCFGGTLEEARQIIELGFYLGIGGVVTYKNSGLKEILQQLSLEHIVLETDAPYLTPVPHRGKRNEPEYIKLVCASLAVVFGKSAQEVSEITSRNAMRVFAMKD